MKVLFAVNNDKISEAVIKKYPKEYKELLSYKNVYYFNAILKEIQNDKSYDRIVISEDLEPFVNTNNDSIDNFIFSNLDRISDEAQGNDGKEISIILICSERRTFGSGILNKLFSIGIYNALIGNDRSMDNLCKLINRPRNKKEAKLYYKIDQATYESAMESGEVSETEIQNILNHFKKLGKSTDRYTDSFNNIAGQYTDDQLKLIINVLPMKVKAVLEAESEKYQTLMGTSGGVKKQTVGPQEPGIRVNTIGSGRENINGSIVIPSGVRNSSNGSRPVIPTNTGSRQQVQDKPQVNQPQNTPVRPEPVKSRPMVQENPVQKQNQNEPIIPTNTGSRQQVQAKSQVAPVNDNPVIDDDDDFMIPGLNDEEPVIEDVKPEPVAPEPKPEGVQRYTGTIAQVKRTLIARRKVQPTPQAPAPTPVQPNIVEDDDLEVDDVKRGRGRPRKPIEEQDIKPKGKRGRPRKNLEEENSNLDDLLNNIEPVKQDEDVMMPGLDDEVEESVLPGLEDEEEEGGEEVDVNSLLAGLDDSDSDSSLPGLDDDETEEDSGVLPGLDEAEETDDTGLLPGLEEDETENDDSGLLPGLEDDSDDSGVLPGLDDNDQEETTLPGMGFEDDNDYEENNINNGTNSIESIKPEINYSMSNLNSLLSKDKKIVSFVGATKNGTSFIINNLALMFSMMGIDVAILDMTKNRNSYYLFTDSREELRKIAYTSLSKLENGYADGIKFNKNLTVYTGLPSDGNVYENAEPILSTLVQNHSLILIDTDFDTPPAYFASSQEIYLVQSMDIMTIQPLTAFLRDLKVKGAWEPEKARVIINKEVPIRILNSKMIIGGMSRYNGPDMSVMTDLFNKDMVKACSIPFDEKVYAKYLETLATCKLSISSLPKQFRAKLQILGEMVYPRLNSKTSYDPTPNMGGANYGPQGNNFSSNTNNTLNKMKKNF